uniref:Uncharacterized protein n=1 Tax=Anguilla anguilla TaxID=7936 RepID=A0A0E9SCQ4_ANGAN
MNVIVILFSVLAENNPGHKVRFCLCLFCFSFLQYKQLE